MGGRAKTDDARILNLRIGIVVTVGQYCLNGGKGCTVRTVQDSLKRRGIGEYSMSTVRAHLEALEKMHVLRREYWGRTSFFSLVLEA